MRMQLVAFDEAEAKRLRQFLADRGFAGAADAHDDDGMGLAVDLRHF